MKDRTYSKRNFSSLHLIVGIVVIVTVATTWLGWIAFKTSDDLFDLQKKHKEIANLQGKVAQYDEVLTMSALMGAATGDTKWEKRYHLFEPQLDETIKRLVDLQPKGVKAAEETDAANIALVEMELQAFSFIHKKNRRTALSILFSDSYQMKKSIYANGMSELYENINRELNKESTKYKEKTRQLRITLILLMTISAFGWLYIFEKIRRWNDKLRSLNEQLDAEVNEQAKKLLNSSKMSALGEMAGGIAHEVNSPLAAIKSLSGQLQEILDDDPLDKALVKTMASQIEKTTDRIAKIVQGLRSFSRDGSKDPFYEVNVHQLVEETLSFCNERFKNNGTEIVVENFDKNLNFNGRTTEISQVLLNLLNNAYDAISELKEKWIRISVFDQPDWVNIKITDSGNGIPNIVREKIFQPFFTTKKIGKGTGMGLSISIGIIATHGGTLTLDDQCANTCFVIRLPKKQTMKQAA